MADITQERNIPDKQSAAPGERSSDATSVEIKQEPSTPRKRADDVSEQRAAASWPKRQKQLNHVRSGDATLVQEQGPAHNPAVRPSTTRGGIHAPLHHRVTVVPETEERLGHDGTGGDAPQHGHGGSAAGLPEELMQILGSNRSLDAKVFQGVIDETVDHVFAGLPDGSAASLGWTHLAAVVATIGGGGVSDRRREEIARLLKVAWRGRIANAIGRGIARPEDLQTFFHAVLAASPFPPDRVAFTFRGPLSTTHAPRPAEEHAASPEGGADTSGPSSPQPKHRPSSPLNTPVRHIKEERRGMQVAAGGDSLEHIKHDPDRATGEPLEQSVAPITPHPSDAEPTHTIAPRPESIDARAEHHADFERRCVGPFRTFFGALQRESVYLQDLDGAGAVESGLFDRAQILYDSLAAGERKAWQKLGSNRSRRAASRPLLETQRILARFEDTLDLTPRREPSPKPEERSLAPPARPVWIPFADKGGRDCRYRVGFLLNLPGMPWLDLSAARLRDACLSTFRKDSGFVDVEQWSEYEWTARFKTERGAGWVKRLGVSVNGIHLVAATAWHRAPTFFSASFVDVNVDEEQMAWSVAHAFAEFHVQPTLSIQHCPKLYAGRQVYIRVPAHLQLIHFYLPMALADGSGVHVACFAPLDPSVYCNICRQRHGMFDFMASGTTACISTRDIELPDLSAGSGHPSRPRSPPRP